MRYSLLLLGAICACSNPADAPPTPSLWQTTGDAQTGVPGFRLASPIVLHLADADGRAIVGDTIDIATSDQYALVEPSDVGITDSSGNVKVYWRLGGSLGTQTLSARSRLPGAGTGTVSATARSNQLQSVDGGDTSLCGVTTDGVLGCWLPGRAGVADLVANFKPVNSSLRFTKVAMTGTALHDSPYGGSSACALTVAGRAWCFHVDSMANASGGAELAGSYPPLAQVVSSGYTQSTYCALAGTGQAYCWGPQNTSGVLGDGTFVPHTMPAAVAGSAQFVQLDIGYNTVCGVTVAGQAMCWGSNSGQLAGGSSSVQSLTAPTLVVSTSGLSSIRVSGWEAVACGFAGGGSPLCWGQLGNLVPGAATTGIPTSVVAQSNAIDLIENYNVNDQVDGGLKIYFFNRSAALRLAPPYVGGESDHSVLPAPGLLRDVMISHGSGFICGHAATGNVTLCVGNRIGFGDVVPAGGFLVRPAVVGVPFQ